MADKLLIALSGTQVSAERRVGGRLGACTAVENSESGTAGNGDPRARGYRLHVNQVCDAGDDALRL